MKLCLLTRAGVVACLGGLAAACGGLTDPLLAQVGTDAGGPEAASLPVDAATPARDASPPPETPDAPTIESPDGAASQDGAAAPQPPAPPAWCSSLTAADQALVALADGDAGTPSHGWVFTRLQDLRFFFSDLDIAACKDASPGAVDCAQCKVVSTCAYNALDSTETMATPYGAFVAPDGHTYVWAYLPTVNEWLLAREDGDPSLYDRIVRYNELALGLSAPCVPECSCEDPGDAAGP